MEIIRDLFRDLVGIIFPGSFTVFVALCFLISLLFLIFPESVGEVLSFSSSSGAFLFS